ncbi:MAG: hypothetical protein QHC79_10405 [Pseudosphingobacterium sp.]|nr:hypothetical protein [Pseudosphingobacterium sp.]
MEDLLKTADEIAEKMKEKGYEYFNIKGGAAGTDFRTGIASYLHYASFNDTEPVFPIYAGSGVASTSPDNPYTWATFKVVEDAQKGLRIDTVRISMYECHDGALRTHLELKIKSPDDIPSREIAAKLIEEKWEARYKENQIVNHFKSTGMISKNDPDYIFDEYKGHIIASHKNNVVGRDIDNLIIVYHSDDFPNHGFIIGLDDSKMSGRRKSVPHNMDDARAYIDWVVDIRQKKAEIKPKDIVDTKAYDLRVNKGTLPTIDISGHTFYVDIRMDMLRPKDDFLSKGIVFSKIANYYDEDKRTYTIPYNPKTHEFQEPDYHNIKELPKDLIAVEFSSERLLDRVGWNRKYGFDLTHGLDKSGLKLEFTAKEVPWKETFLVSLIESNLKAEKKQEKAAENQKSARQDTKRKGRKI